MRIAFIFFSLFTFLMPAWGGQPVPAQVKGETASQNTLYGKTTVYVDAKCTNQDSKVLGYSWEVNGELISSTSYRISLQKTAMPQSATVTIRGIDDAKELSSPVSINVNY
jgi:hypothetical protein